MFLLSYIKWCQGIFPDNGLCSSFLNCWNDPGHTLTQLNYESYKERSLAMCGSQHEPGRVLIGHVVENCIRKLNISHTAAPHHLASVPENSSRYTEGVTSELI